MNYTPEQEKAIQYPEGQRADSGSAVVTAAAGSGKTSLLVERVIRMLCNSDPDMYISADKIAILTFTNNAAAEFRTRMTASISAKAKEAAKNNPESREFIKTQLIKFRSAVISTINAFCLGILRENSESFGLPVNFSILDEAKTSVIRAESMDKTKEYFYSHEFDENERDLLFKTFSFDSDRILFEKVETIYNKITSLVDPDEFLNRVVDNYQSLDKLSAAFMSDYIAPFEFTIAKAQMYLNQIIDYIETYADFDDGTLAALAENDQILLDGIRSRYEVLKGGADFAALEKFLDSCETKSLGFARFNKKGFDKDNPDVAQALEDITALRDRFKKAVKKLTENKLATETLEAETLIQKRTITSFVTLIRKFREEYSIAKLNAGFVDFNDCERLLLDRLKADKGFCEEIGQRFNCIIVDEFQDTSDLQYEIFRLISRDEGNLFVVGDIKQSIYAFRGGNPRLMLGLIKDSDKFQTLPLNKNFRSRKNVIDTVNDMFTGFMTEQYGDVDYNGDSCLYFGADFYPEAPSENHNNSELHILDIPKETEVVTESTETDGKKKPTKLVKVDNHEEEAKYTARLIRKMVDEKFLVTDKSVLRPCRYGDFAILLRASTHMPKYKKALDEYLIPSNINGSGDYLENEEITLLLNLLKTIDNPLHDDVLLNVVMSPLYMFSAEEIAQARLGILGLDTENLTKNETMPLSKEQLEALSDEELNEQPSGKPVPLSAEEKGEFLTYLQNNFKYKSLYSCIVKCACETDEAVYISNCGKNVRKLKVNIKRAANSKCLGFIENLKIFRSFKNNNSIERLIGKIYDDTDFLSVIATYEQNERKLANIRLMLKYAADFETNGGGTLSEFVRYTDKVREAEKKKSEKGFKDAKTGAEAQNSVGIMTFHKSKGLEMPIVILGQLGKGENNMDTSGTIVFNKDSGLGIRYVDTDVKVRYSCKPFAFTSIANTVRLSSYGEELRLLYVAMTRAKDKLIMIGQHDTAEARTLMNSEFSPESALVNDKAICWIISSLTRNTYKNRHIDITEFYGTVGKAEQCHTEEAEIEPTKPDNELAESISAAIQKQYGNLSQTTAQSKYTVTEIAHMIDEQVAEVSENNYDMIYIRKPSFFSKNKVTGKDVGDSYHHAMELIPLQGLVSGSVSTEYVEAELQKLNAALALQDDEIGNIDPAKIAQFFNSPLGERMLKSRKIEREYPIFAEVSAESIYVPDRTDNVIVQGRADMFFYEEDGIVLVDYKSDSRENLKNEFEAYRKQLSIYKTILPIITGVKVKGIYIYSFSEGREFPI